ncbi:MAG: PDZ domain-containing protein [Clostridia bacterium]|nr:PDZ domain-containing protein [Clostridia bacterium]
MGDFDKFQPDNREHDEWADSFFAEVLSGAGTASRPKTRLYGQFGNEPDEPETGVNETAREQENASAVTEQRLEEVQPRSDTVFDPSSVTSRLRGYSTPAQNANVATQNADVPAQNPDGEPAGNKAPESGENASGPYKEAEPALGTEPETEPDNEPETDADADKKRRRITIAIIAILLAVLLFLVGLCGYYIGRISSRVSTKKAATGYSVDFTEQGLDDEQTAKLQSVYRFIIDNYYTDVDPNELIEGAVRGMAESINDPYGSYYRPGKMSDYTDFIDGSYNGIGMTVKTVDGSIIVTEVAEDSPASRAGIVPGDIVKAVNGKSAEGVPLSELRDELSKTGAEIVLTIENEGVTRDVRCTVEKIIKKTVSTRDLGGGLKYIRITQFIGGTAEEFRKALLEITEDGADGLIIDLRGNPGGYVSEAAEISDILLPEGTVAVSKRRDGTVVSTLTSDANGVKVPMVMLVNGGTASASELLAGAFRDFKAGTIVGSHTYGKALAQINLTFESDGSGIVLSTHRYFTPSGECIDGVGIEPDVTVLPAEEYKNTDPDNIPEGEDAVLNMAIEILNN